jgi:threonine/homoserine/homoserine lactone efflux protein
MEDSIVAFLVISVIVIVTPGQDTALTIRNTLSGGRNSGIATGFGVACGQAVWVLAATLGIVALLAAYEPVFSALKLVGAGYLIILGLQSLNSALRPNPSNAKAEYPAGPSGLLPGTAFIQGVVSNLGNPKMAVFFASLLPQFVPQDTPANLALLGLIFCTMTFVWLTAYAVCVVRAGNFLRRPNIRRSLEGLTGLALAGLGVRIASTSD